MPALLCALAVGCSAAPGVTVTPAPTSERAPSPSSPSTPTASDGGHEALAPLCDELVPEVTVDGPLSDDPAVAAAQRQRAEWGLASDVATVEALMAEHPDTEFGIPATPEEVAALHARNPEHEDTNAIRAYAAEQAPDTYGGIWIDHRRGGALMVAFTRDAAHHERTIEELLGDVDIVAVTVTNSHAELERVRGLVAEDARPSPEGTPAWHLTGTSARVVGLGTRDDLNRVALDVLDLDDGGRRELAERYGVGFICVNATDELFQPMPGPLGS